MGSNNLEGGMVGAPRRGCRTTSWSKLVAGLTLDFWHARWSSWQLSRRRRALRDLIREVGCVVPLVYMRGSSSRVLIRARTSFTPQSILAYLLLEASATSTPKMFISSCFSYNWRASGRQKKFRHTRQANGWPERIS